MASSKKNAAKADPFPEPAGVSTRVRHRIREWRDFRKLTQEQLAEKIGMATSTISQLEAGLQGYREETLLKIADALETSPGAVLDRDPGDTEAPWALWAKLTPEQRSQAITFMKVLSGAVLAETL